jgi:hypothetical protein
MLYSCNPGCGSGSARIYNVFSDPGQVYKKQCCGSGMISSRIRLIFILNPGSGFWTPVSYYIRKSMKIIQTALGAFLNANQAKTYSKLRWKLVNIKFRYRSFVKNKNW